MIIFQTPRLDIRIFNAADKGCFVELVTKPEIIAPISQAPMPTALIEDKFARAINPKGSIFKNETSYLGDL